MDKLYLDSDGQIIKREGPEHRREVRFPVCISVVHHGHSTEACSDFILNISLNGVFVLTKSALPIGTSMTLRFHIPPEQKVLSEFEGIVAGVNIDDPRFPKGMHVKFTASRPEDRKRLEDFLDGKKQVLDIRD
ncbi:MAG: PilZ domain-containing protein [Deltaproteobacteria bacterium]|nr:PilZ domain-containing protein [Deltaproteobacteria bacterium]